MSTKRVAGAIVLCAAATAMLSVRADQPVNLAVDMGLWEVTTHAQISGGIPPQMQERLKSMSPEQRQQVEAAMQSMMANAQREHVFRECMTPERLSRGFDTGKDSSQCKSTLVSNTRTDFEFHRVCMSQDGGSHTEKAVFHRADRHHVSGTVDILASERGRPTKIHEMVDGTWLASSCGNVKDVETVR